MPPNLEQVSPSLPNMTREKSSPNLNIQFINQTNGEFREVEYKGKNIECNEKNHDQDPPFESFQECYNKNMVVVLGSIFFVIEQIKQHGRSHQQYLDHLLLIY